MPRGLELGGGLGRRAGEQGRIGEYQCLHREGVGTDEMSPTEESHDLTCAARY